jgi:hypothetical protein
VSCRCHPNARCGRCAPTCAICTDAIIGPVKQEPLGRGNAMVNVCVTCATEHPRHGRYGFGETYSPGARGIGEGNRHPSGKGNRRG